MHDFDQFKKMFAFYFSRVFNKPLIEPEHAYICITNRCNLRCKICNIWADKTPPSHELKYEEYEKLLDQLANLNIKHLIFSGGEPFLRKDFFKILNYANKKNFENLDVVTNATLIDNKCAKEIIKSGLTTLTVSIDGFEKEHDHIRGKGVFKKAVNAIKLLERLNNRKNFSIMINTVITGRNFKMLPEFINFFKNTKCIRVSLQPVLPDNTAMTVRNTRSSNLWLSENKLKGIKEIIDKLIELKKSSKDYHDFIYINEGALKLLPSYFLKKECDFECFEGLNRIVITPYGDIWTCRGTISNIRKEPLKEIWNSEKAKNIRKKIARCKIPCLQGCVYIYDYESINKTFDNLLLKIKSENEETKKTVIHELYNLLENYILLVNKELKPGFFKANKEYIKNQKLLKNFKSKLDAI